jgi:hypothetical protein
VIGSVGGEDGTDIRGVHTAKLLPNGHVALVGLDDPRIRVFDSNTGAFVRFIGRDGGGPGEFRAAPMIAPSTDGGIWAWDPGSRRVSLFSTDGRLRREHRFTSAQMIGVPNSFTGDAWQIAPTGTVLSTAAPAHGVGAEAVRTQRIILMRLDRGRSVIIGPPLTTRGVREDPYVMFDRFTSPRAAAMLAGKIYLSQAGPWQVDVYDTEGRLQKIIRLAVPRTAVTDEVRSRERAYVEQAEPALAQLFDRLPSTDSISAIKGFRPSSDGMIWVLRWNSRVEKQAQIFDVVDPQGRWMGTVKVPADAGEVVDVTPERILTTWHDDLDVPYLRVYRLSAEVGH